MRLYFFLVVVLPSPNPNPYQLVVLAFIAFYCRYTASLYCSLILLIAIASKNRKTKVFAETYKNSKPNLKRV